MHDGKWGLRKFSTRALRYLRKSACGKKFKSMRPPSDLSLQLIKQTLQKSESCNLNKNNPYKETRLKTNSNFSPFVIK